MGLGTCTHTVGAVESLWVITAHAHDALNAQLLQQSVASVRCFHPHEPIVVVDNDSPPGVVAAALRSERYPGLRIVRQVPSVGQLAGMMVADELWGAVFEHANLDGTGRVGSRAYPRRRVEQLVFLMHSTHLCRALPPRREGCDAMAIGGALPMASAGRMFNARKVPRSGSWIAKTTAAMGLSLCGVHVRPSRNATPAPACLAWSSALHSSIVISRDAWDYIRRHLRVWPAPASETRKGVAGARDVDEPHQHLPRLPQYAGLCDARSAIADTRDACNSRHPLARGQLGAHDAPNGTLTELIVGFERLSGVYVAAANAAARTAPAHSDLPFDFCALPAANLNETGVLYKTHGRSYEV